MRFFSELAADVDTAWKRADYDHLAFPEIAAACLEQRRPSDHVGLLDVVQWVHSTRDITSWTDFDPKFGQPAVRVYKGLHFYIEVLVWVDSTTSIHQHGFAGAFHVMDGSSIHSHFGFQRSKRYSEPLVLGDLSLQNIELLERGAVRPIASGERFIHSLFHLDHPSVSVVVRTPGIPSATPQYSYHRAGIGYDPAYGHESLYLRIETLGLLAGLGHPAFLDTAVNAIQSATAPDAFFLVRSLAARLGDSERVNQLLDAVGPAHPELLPRLRALELDQRREFNITLRRKDIQEKAHRFFLALLLNVTSRKDFLRLVHQAYPETPPVAQVVRWVSELANMPLRDRATGEMSNVIGLRLDEIALKVLGHLLSGANDEQVLSRFREEFDDADVDEQKDDLLSLCDQFRKSLLFGALLQP
ncbi:MAG TPA: hypothetical protein VGI39_29075 [Polyangiaceae bacterium]